MAPTSALQLQESDQERLETLTRMATAPAGLVQRARIVLLAAQGMSNTETASRLGVSRPTVLKWRSRYEKSGIDALGDLPRPGRPPVVDESSVLVATLADGGRPPARLGATRWSSRRLAEELGLAHSTVSKVWRRWGVQSQQPEAFRPPTVPAIEPEAREVVALRLAPPWNAVVLRAIEPPDTGFALGSTFRMGGHSPSSPATSRAQPVRTVAAKAQASSAFLSFLESVAASHPRMRLLVVVDGRAPLNSQQVRAWLARNVHVTMHRTLAERSWQTLTEVLLRCAGRVIVQGGVFESTPAMRDSLQALLDIPLSSWREHAAPLPTGVRPQALLTHSPSPRGAR